LNNVVPRDKKRDGLARAITKIYTSFKLGNPGTYFYVTRHVIG